MGIKSQTKTRCSATGFLLFRDFLVHFEYAFSVRENKTGAGEKSPVFLRLFLCVLDSGHILKQTGNGPLCPEQELNKGAELREALG